MEPVRLWAAVEFTAQSGSTDALLGLPHRHGLHLTRIVPLPGGFRARCAAWHYRRWPLWPARGMCVCG